MQTSRIRTIIVAASALSAVFLASACSTVGYGSAESTAAQAPAAQTSQNAESTSSVTAQVANQPTLGRIVTDANGMTLYRFDKDTAKPPQSNCADACAKAWPPVLVTQKPVVQGIDPGLIGTVKRADGAEQLTLAGWPLYRFAKDTKAGDINGQGVQGTWFVAAPDGKKAKAPASATTSKTPASGYGSGY